MKFDTIVTNPPFQDRLKRGKTPHKLWIDFTLVAFERLLAEGGVLAQVSPASFCSPNSRVLDLMKSYETLSLRFPMENNFPSVASTFADYVVRKRLNDHEQTLVTSKGRSFSTVLGPDLFYLPTDMSEAGLSVHNKVMFGRRPVLDVRWDYVTCHNVLVHRDGSVGRDRSSELCYPVLHTNKQIWWSSKRQAFASAKKVMWSRSGYTIPFFDDGELGCTDMGYYILVSNEDEGKELAATLNMPLYQYIFSTAKWSGFGNERVFANLPVPPPGVVSGQELGDFFGLSQEEVNHVNNTVARRRGSRG